MLFSAVSVLIGVQLSSGFPEGLTNYPVFVFLFPAPWGRSHEWPKHVCHWYI